jgi:hypothetical protein
MVLDIMAWIIPEIWGCKLHIWVLKFFMSNRQSLTEIEGRFSAWP